MKSKTGLIAGAGIVVLVAVCAVFVIVCKTSYPSEHRPVMKGVRISPPTRSVLLKLVNSEREKKGVKPLTEEHQLDDSAQYKADDMNNRNYFSHEDPNTGKRNGLDKLFLLTGDQCTYASENIYYGEQEFNSSEEAVRWWVHSKPHFAAMVDGRYDSTGFGISNGNVVEHFCDEA